MKKKHPKDMTTDEAVRHLFPTNVHKHLHKVAHEKEGVPKKAKPSSRPKR